MKKLFLILFCVFFAGNASLFADDFDKEQVILNGLSKKQLKERVKFLEMAKLTDSAAIFEKLTQMYKVNNSIKEDVFFAMQAMNMNNDGKFSSEFAEAIKEEYFRLKAQGWASDPPIFYLIGHLSGFQRRPYSGYDNFVDYIMLNIDEVLPVDTHPAIRTDILAECTLYFATRDRPGYMQKLAEVYNKDEISAELRVYDLFTAKKDPAIFEEFTRRLSQQSKEEYSGSEFKYYEEYANAIGKTIPKNIQEKIEEDKQLRIKRVEFLLKDFGK